MGMDGYATWLADVLRGSGVKVVEYDGWKTRGHGGFSYLDYVVWHHDASPPGDSPGVPRYMLSNWNNAGAQLWVSRAGVWHVLAAGVAYHAGTVLSGKPSNRNSLGVETDLTTGEQVTQALMDSLRVGTKAIFARLATNSSHLEFHKTIASPKGRKTDPYNMDLTTERAMVSSAGLQHAPLTLGSRTLGLGDEGEDVHEFQELMLRLYPHIGVDGEFGPETDGVVRDFQFRAGLKLDGLVGATTLAAIRAAARQLPASVVLPVPVVLPKPKGSPMFMFRDSRTGGVFLREGGTTTHLATTEDAASLFKAGIPNVGDLTHIQCDKLGTYEALTRPTAAEHGPTP